MDIVMIGLGRMGANLVHRLRAKGHRCFLYDHDPTRIRDLTDHDSALIALESLEQIPTIVAPRRIVWIMVPAGQPTTSVITQLSQVLSPADIIIDGGNSYYRDDHAHAQLLEPTGILLLDCGTSGGIWGKDRGYCLMIGGPEEPYRYAEPIFASLAPGFDAAPPTIPTSHPSCAEQGYLHCGPCGAGHFVKMVHNGIEYGMMAALAEGFNILRHANVGHTPQSHNAETAPMTHPEYYCYDIDLKQVAELWRRGSVISSWLLDLTSRALHHSVDLEEFHGRVSDSGEGRWSAISAIEEGVPAPVLTAALYSRFTSQHSAEFSNKLLSAMRHQFGGHHEQPSS